MSTFKEQVERMVKFTSIFREGIKDDEDFDLAEIDRGLDNCINSKIEEEVEELFQGKNNAVKV